MLKMLIVEMINAQKNLELQKGLRRAVANVLSSVDNILKKHPELSEIAEHVKSVREEFLEKIEYYVSQAIKNINASGAQAYLVSSPEEVLEVVDKIIGKEKKLIVKAKSMVTEEVRLREHLTEMGHEVYETDLGEFLIQISNSKPMHAIVPALHLSKEQVTELFSQRLGLSVNKSATHEELVLLFRSFLREKFVRADVGISGANAIAADTGAILIVHNEGNVNNILAFPPVHIVITSVEKIVPTFKDALLQIMVQSGYAGLYPPTYLNIISGVSSTADIEYKRVYGAHGARKVYVIIYDGGRLKASKHYLLKEQLRCIKCGRCQVSCPIWIVNGNFWGGKVYGGPMGVGWTAITEGVEKAEPLAWFCLLCNACKEVCPVKVDSAEISRKMRIQNIEKGIVPTKIKEILENIYKHGNPFGLPRTRRGEWANWKVPRYTSGVQVLYYVGDMGSYHPRAQKAARTLAEVLAKAKVSFGILGESENCSGSEPFEIGETGLFEEIANSNVQLFKSLNVREIVTFSPHSYNVMKNYYRLYGGEFTVKHYTQLIMELLDKGKFELKNKVDKTITFHDPCFLGRWNNEYNAPRHVLESISTVKLVEMRRNKQNSLCCGGGSGNSYIGFGCGLLIQNEATPCRIRVKEAYETGAEILAVACPSCLIMLEEAVKEEGLEDKIVVKDVAEIISQTL